MGKSSTSHILCISGVKFPQPTSTSVVFHNIVENITRGNGMQIHLCNVYTFSRAFQDERVMEAIISANFNLIDGKGITFFLGRNFKSSSIRGADLVRYVLQHGDKSIGHFVVGSDAVTISKLALQYPNSNFVGFNISFFDENEIDFIEQLALEIELSGAKVIWLVLGTPKQDVVLHQLSSRLPKLVFIAVGAAFGLVAGQVKEAPVWMQQLGMEWFFRLLTEPKRLLSRYSLGTLTFLRFFLKIKKLGQITIDND